MAEADADPRLKRLRIRSWRRGIREMDLILGTWSDRHLTDLGPSELDLYESLLSENDHDLYGWFSGRSETPEAFRGLVARIAADAEHLGST